MTGDSQLPSRFPALTSSNAEVRLGPPTTSLPEHRLDSTEMLERVAPVRQENKKGLDDDTDSLKTYMAQSVCDSISVIEDEDLSKDKPGSHRLRVRIALSASRAQGRTLSRSERPSR